MIEHAQSMYAAFGIARGNYNFMFWNTFLALVPLVLAYALFSDNKRKLVAAAGLTVLTFSPRMLDIFKTVVKIFSSMNLVQSSFCAAAVLLLGYFVLFSAHKKRIGFVLGSIVFLLFLPNAPYVLTDVIHMIELIRVYPSEVLITVVVIPLFAVFMLIGFEAYVLSLMELESFMRRNSLGAYVRATELSLHLLSSVGIYMGRFLRFNSWDVATNPDTIIFQTLNSLSSRNALLLVGVSFVIITALYIISKTIISALRVHREHKRVLKTLPLVAAPLERHLSL